LPKRQGAPFFYIPLALHSGMDAPASARFRDHDSSTRVACRSRPLDGKPSRGLFLCPLCHARAGEHHLAGPEPVTGCPRRTRGWRATACEPGGGLPLTEYICIQILYGFD